MHANTRCAQADKKEEEKETTRQPKKPHMVRMVYDKTLTL